MKKMFLHFFVLLSLTACGGGSTTTTSSSESGTPSISGIPLATSVSAVSATQ